MKVDIPISGLQKRIMQSQSEVTVVSCGRGAGKTACIALIAIMRMLKGEHVLIVAPSFRQASRDDYAAIVNFLYEAGLNFLCNAVNLKIRYNKGEITILSSFGATQETFRGATKISTLIFDEAGSQPHTAYALALPTMRDLGGAKRRIYLIGTPPYSEDHWMAKGARREDAAVFYGSAHDNPFIEKDYVDLLEREYAGFPDDFKQREIYGKMIFDIDNSSMFSDFKIVVGDFKFIGEPIVAGLDIAGRGSDMTCMAIIQGRQVIAIETQKTANEDALKNWVSQMHGKYNYSVLRYDSTGFGHLLNIKGIPARIVPVDFGGSGGERFAKRRGLIYHKLARKETIYMSHNLYNSHGRLAEAELKATCYIFNEGRLINLVKKDKIKELLGRSPDRADALALAFSHDKPDPAPAGIRMAPVFGQGKSSMTSMREI
jgi:hypothetical protein